MIQKNIKTPTIKEQIILLKQDLRKPGIKSNPITTSKIYEQLGGLYFFEKNYKEGTLYFDKAIKIAKEENNKLLEAQIIGLKGTEYLNHGLPEEGYLCFEEVIKLAEEINELGLKCDALGSIALVQLETGDPGLAIQKLNESLSIAEEIKDKKRIMMQVGTLGNTYLHLAAHEEAEKYFERAIELSEEIEDNESYVGYLNNYAIILDNTGRKDEAVNKLLKVQKICKEINYYFGERNALQQLIKIDLESNRQSSSVISHLKRAIKLSIELEDEISKNEFSEQLVLVLFSQNRQIEAIEYIKSELDKDHNKIPTKYSLGLLTNLGNAYYDLNNLQNALETYLKALKVSKELQLENFTARLYGKISAVLADQGDYQKALENSKLSLKIAENIDNTQLIAEQFSLMAMSYRDLGNSKKAIEFGGKALKLYEDNDQKLHIEQLNNFLSEIKTPE